MSERRGSLRRRLLVAATVVTLLSLVTIGVVLDAAFRGSALQGQRERLLGHVYTLLAAIEVGAEGPRLQGPLPEPRLEQPRSGLYAWLVAPDGDMLWRSASTMGHDTRAPPAAETGESRFETPDETGFGFRLRYGLDWETAGGELERFTVVVAESASAFAARMASFRRSLWGWLGAGATLLLAFQAAMLRWSLAPLRRVGRDLAALEAGDRDALAEDYPREIAQLTRRINTLVDSERRRAARHRENLDNLAHSLKTPLAVVSGVLEEPDPDGLEEARRQVRRIDRSIDYHVRRGSLGAAVPGEGVALSPLAERLAHTLRRAHAHRGGDLSLEVDCPPDLRFAGSEDELMEVLGNLLDNAFKWCRRHIRLQARAEGPRRLTVSIEDDGPGIPDGVREQVLRRGVRLDRQVPGQGIGLALVAELVSDRGGRLSIEQSGLGGARLEVRLPALASPSAGRP